MSKVVGVEETFTIEKGTCFYGCDELSLDDCLLVISCDELDGKKLNKSWKIIIVNKESFPSEDGYVEIFADNISIKGDFFIHNGYLQGRSGLEEI